MSAGSLLVVVWLLGHILLATAQTTNATCDVAHNWAFNSQKQSPCQVASSLLAVCTGSYEVFALPPNFHYEGPDMQDANPCQCNTVVYSLLAECALCQERTITMWSLWETNCASVSISSFPMPLPAGLHVPGWAYLDVETSDSFNETLAFADANITESTAIPQPTKTSSSKSVPTSSSTSSSAAAVQTTVASDTSVSPPVDQKRSNAIGGGIVGGFAALLLVFVLFFWIYRRRKTVKENGAILASPVMSEYRTDTLPSPPTMPVPSITVSSLNSQPPESIHSAV
ncbi:hypothetical protein MSAN_01017300 [Mycena sanguinolenta]|uniref:Mid2 domain-containing protein n=1 Tax=Mycena sanguinolenta TaxID=230812 RepID=A0A8H6YS77_9AGAR|nr:hypothetical protein MSAN_01017300 [Mycena sanguinolenta]